MKSRISILVAVSLIVVFGCSKDKPTSSDGPELTPGEHQVRYELTGTEGRKVTVSWIDSDNRIKGGDLKIPQTFNAIRSDSEYVSLRAKYSNVGGALALVRCEIFVDGKLWRTEINAGNLLDVHAEGHIGIDP